MTIVHALLLGALAFIGKLDLATGTSMISRPIVLGPLVGLVLGNFEAGVKIGATLELAFLGQYSVGAYIPPNVIVGGILGTAFAITTGKGADIAFTMAFPIAMLMQIIDNLLFSIVRPMLAKVADRYAEQGNPGGIDRIHFACGLITCTALFIVTAAGYALGSAHIQAFVDAIPEVITKGLSIACGILPALGFAMLARMVMSGKVLPFFFLGFAVAAYFGLPIVAIAVLGVLLVAIMMNNYGFASPQAEAIVEGEDDDF
ncbi:PTS mannose/fructose/sorbose/N-acetylgalactosamine transporter subunit IIC [Ileibacterium valens]|uniref:PTS mannose/fructose/sorbose/N-acetylgalactosamine transporter subunit IIC n=1 Tax=Ileibacterium valens TaxID=1862668 RepID=UPI00272BF89D|nr:PTS sugar transporter subunit IIC [Ileibacterium valens]